MDNEVKKLYSALINKGYTTKNLGDEQTFMSKMQDADNRKQLYDWVNARGDFRIGSYEDYEKRLTAPPAPKAEDINPTGDKSGYTLTAEELGMPENTYRSESTSVAKLPEIKPMEVQNVKMDPEKLKLQGEALGNLNKEKEMLEAQLDEVRRKASERRKAITSNAGAYQFGMAPVTGNVTSEVADIEMAKLGATENQLEQAIREVDRKISGEDAGFWQGVLDATVRNPGFYTMGMSDMSDARAMLDLSENGINSETDLALADATYENSALQEEADRGFMYRAGNMFGHSIPFMVQMAASGGGTGISKLGGKAAQKFAKETLKHKILRATGVVADDLLESAFIANTAGAGTTQTNILQRKAGQLRKDAQDGYYFEGKNGWLEAAAKGEMSSILEQYTEKFGNHLDGKLSITKGLDKIGAKRISTALAAAKNSDIGKAANTVLTQFGINGVLPEVMEEEANLVLNSIFVGDNKLSDLFDLQTQLDIVGGMFLTVGTMRAIPGAIGSVGYIRNQRKLNAADKEAEAVYGEKWAEIRERLNNASNEEVADVCNSMIGSGNDQALLDYYKRMMVMRGYNIGTTKREDNIPGAEQSYQEGYEAADEQKGAVKQAYDMERERVLNTFGEEVVQKLDDDPIGALMELNEVDRQEAIAYVNAKTAYEGMIDRISDDIDERIKASDKEIDSHANRQDGAIHPAMMRGVNGAAPKRVYIVNGNVATFEDGTIDKANSSSMIIVRDAETGEVSAASADDLESLEVVIDTEAEKKTVAEQIANEYAGQQAGIIEAESGKLTYNSNDGVHTVEILGENGDVFTILDNGVERIATREWVDELKAQNGVVSPVEENAPVVEQTQPVAQTALERVPKAENGEPVYEQADAETAWDAIMEQTNDEELATQVVEGMIADKEAALKKLENSKVREGVTVAEKIAAAQQRKAAIEQAKADLAKWQEIAAVKAKRETAAVESAPVEDNTPQSQSDSSPILVEQPTPQATNEMQPVSEPVAPTAEEIADAQAFADAFAQNTVEAYLNYLDKFPEGAYREGARRGIWALEGTSSVVDVASITNAENVLQRAQAAQEADLENTEKGEKGQKAVEPVGENNESTISQTSDQVGDQVVDRYTLKGDNAMLKDMEALRKSNREEYSKIQPAYELLKQAKERGLYPNELEELRAIVKGTSLEGKVDGWFTPVMAEGGNAPGQSGVEENEEVGPFGRIYRQFKGKAKEAIQFLLGKKEGEAVGALSHPEIGDIDLVWGEEGTSNSDGYGLAKLAKYHPEVLDNLQEIINDMRVTKRSANRVQLESDTHQAAVRLTWDNKSKNWLLTAFEKKNSVSDNTTDTGETSDGGKQNDTATLQNTVSTDEGTTQSAKVQENAQESEDVKEVSEETTQAENEVAKQEDKDVAAFDKQAEIAKEREQRAGVAPRLGHLAVAIGEGNEKAVEEWKAKFDSYLQKLNADDLPTIDATIKGMQGRKKDIRKMKKDGYKDDSIYKAYDYIETVLKKRAAELKKVSATEQPKQEKSSQGERSKGKTESESKQEVEKIEDVGEVLAGARKDALKVLASSFENATVKSLIELPFSKAFKKPDLKKAVESGALREEDALFYEAMFNALINSSKPKNSARHRNAVETWAEETYNSLQLIKSFVEADEAARDRAMAEALEDKFPARAEELAVIEKRKVWNARNNAEWGDKTTPNPVWVAHEVLKALGYKPGDKVEIPFGVLKANVFATGYEFYNKKGERLIMQSVPTVEEGIENIVWLSKIKRGDADTMHPVSSFFATPTKRDMGDSGRYYVLWGTVRNPRRSEFGSIEEANAFAAGHKEAVVRPIQEVVKRYGYKLIFREPITGDKFFVNDMEFETEGEAMQYLEDNYDAVNEQTNELLAKERGEAKKEVSADDLLEVAMVRGKEGWKYAVNIKGKYANNMGMPLLLREFDTREDAKAFLNESKNEVFEIYKKQQAEQKKFVFFDTGENSRIGEDYRGGRDVAAKDFMDTFGFRGVQFGNWTNQEDRQMAVNQAFDAFMDLAKLLGVSPKALSLNGELGMAFGSRGSGFGNAHYEPGEIVINLTKTRGAGSLAHEWWHALDNYFARRANVPMGMVTDSRSIDMRPELRQAYNKLLKMIEKSDFYKRSKAKGDYWGRMHEVTARLMAEWVDQSLKDRGELNTFLSRGVNEERYKRMNYDVHRAVALIKGKEALSYEEFEKTPEALAGFPYPSRAELKEFGDATRNIFETVEEQETEEGDVVLYRSSEDIEAEYPNWLEGTTTDSGKHSTQVEGTRKTYKKVGDWIEENMGKDVAILDASSGMGYGTADLRERGFDIEDVEPYQSEDRKQNNPATYSSYADIEKQYDYIISNAVLNVIPDNWRADLLHEMVDKLKVGGKLFINTRKAGEERSIKDKIELDSPQEVLVKRNGRIASYQRFFTPQELKEWIESEIGDGYTVEIANKANSGTSGLAAVVVTKNEDVLYRLTGEKGAATLDEMEGVTTRMDDLVLAKAMEARGYEPWVIEVATKWRRIKNGQWRYDLGKKKRRNNDRELYNSDLTTEEKRAIQKYIESLPENYASEHPLAFENNGYIYIFNTSRLQYEDNRTDKHDGFNIISKYDLNNIPNEKQNLLRKILGGDIRTNDRVVGEFETWRNDNQSDSMYSAGATAAMEANGVDGRVDKNSQADRGRDTGTGFENEQAEVNREGAGPLTDREVVMESDVYSKVLGKPRYYGKRQREFVARQRRRMAEKARQVAEKLNLNNVEVLESTEGLTGKKATSKGWFDPRTRKITVVVPNHGSTGDIVETVLHEAVAHYGLRKLFGKNFKNFLDNVYRNVTPEIRAEITELAKKHGWDFHTATEEYLASLAENTNFEKVNPSLWSNIKSFFMKMLAKVGITLDEPLGDNELRYILWRSHQNLVNPGWFNVFGQAEDIAKQYELGVGNYASGEVKTENGSLPSVAEATAPLGQGSSLAAEDEIRFREGGAPVSAREEYERKVRRPNKSGSVGATENVAQRAQEAYQDSMLALKILQDAVARETGNEVKDNENAYIAENRMSSSNKAMVEIYERDFFMPLMDEINALIKEGVEYDDIIRYLHAKHGLERNEYMRRKQAEEAAHRDLGEEPAMPNEGDADYEAKVNAKAAWRANLAELTESYVKKFAKRDYSGLTALTETANAKDAEAAAQQMVDEFENDHDTNPLWGAVNKATKETLRREFVGGLIDRATYDTVSTMFDFYIPLRGWDENVAANEYEYFANNNTPVFTPAIKTMHGRKSLSDDPIATIGYMAGSAIARANRNLMKQKFLNFVMNNPTSLATVSEQWYTMDYGTNEWVPNNPAIPEDATPEQVVEIVEAHEANMRALEKAGKATRERSGLKIGLHATKQEEQQHVVRVMRNGKEYAVYINGNPRAAQALNGMTNPDVSKSKAREAAQKVKNFMARAFTSRNPAFIISNSVRDVIWAGTAVAAKEDAEYTKQYTKNVTGVLAKFKLPRLLRKFQNGTLDMNNEIERYFDEFMRNGGETGFTQVLTVEDYKRNIERFTKEAKNGTSIPKKAWRGLWDGIEFLNRSAEDITRFTVYMTSRQMGRSIERSVYDAKEITVNFNKKGSGEMGARYLNFAYIFFNATIQSLANFGRLMARHPGKMAAALGTYSMMGFLMPVINAALMALGDDDDEENYWNLPEWVRRNNIVLFVPWTEKGFITIPLPHEIRPFYGMGENAMSALLGKQSTEDAIKKSLVGFTGMLPIDFTANGGDVVVNVMPTILQPLAQVRANVTHFGTPIYKDNDFNKRYPSWTKAYKGTNSTLVAATKWLNEATVGENQGGNVDKGWLDWNPAVIEHLFESYLGGMGKTFNKTATTVSMLWDEDARIARNIPVASSFYQESDERTASSQLNREYFDALEEMEGFQHRMSGYQKQITKGNAEYEKLFEDLVNSDEFMRYSIIKDYSNAISELNQVLKNNGPTEEEAQEIEGVIQELKNEMLDELEKLQAEE